MKKYVDFDGVILDDLDILFKDYDKFLKNKIVKDDIDYVKKISWERVLKEAEVINNSLDYLMDNPDAIILTKIHSLENEGDSKIAYLRKNGIKNDIIIAPYKFEKHEVVSALGNLLIDDSIRNLINWKKAGGIPIFFDKNGDGIDPFGDKNKEFESVKDLSILKRTF